MKGKQTALFPGNEDKVGFWLTDPKLMAQLQAEFDFDTDAAPYPRPPGYDGTKEEWGKSTWLNPPFEGPRTTFGAWARKAVLEYQAGKTVVMIMPMDTWVRVLIEAGAEIRSLGHVDWYHPNGKCRRSSRPNFLFILRGKP